MPCGFWLPHIFFADRVSCNSGPSRRMPVWSYGTHRESRFYQLSPHQQSSGTRSPDFCVSAAPFLRGQTSARGLAQCSQCGELCRVACQPRRSPEPFDCAESRHTPNVPAPFVCASNPLDAVSYTHLRAHETDSYLVCRLLL